MFPAILLDPLGFLASFQRLCLVQVRVKVSQELCLGGGCFGFIKLLRLVIFLAGLGWNCLIVTVVWVCCGPSSTSSEVWYRCEWNVRPPGDVRGCPLSTRKMGVGIFGFHSWFLVTSCVTSVLSIFSCHYAGLLASYKISLSLLFCVSFVFCFLLKLLVHRLFVSVSWVGLIGMLVFWELWVLCFFFFSSVLGLSFHLCERV